MNSVAFVLGAAATALLYSLALVLVWRSLIYPDIKEVGSR
jgi:hypothetical protein